MTWLEREGTVLCGGCGHGVRSFEESSEGVEEP